MNLQSVVNCCKAVPCMDAYFSKSELETTQALLKVSSKIWSMNLHAREAMHMLASSYLSSRKVSLQEAVYYSLSKHWLTKCSPNTVFVNTSIPSEHIQICNSVEKMEDLDPDRKTNNLFTPTKFESRNSINSFVTFLPSLFVLYSSQ